MQGRKLRNHSYIQELSPTCTKIKNSSANLYNTLVSKYSKAHVQKFVPFLSGISSEDSLKPKKHSSVSIKQADFTIFPKKISKLPMITLPKINDELLSNKPFTDKTPLKKQLTKLASSKKAPITETVSPRMISPAKSKLSKASYKEACRYSEWAMIAKPEIESMWRTLINVSNGIKVVSSKSNYKFYLGKGNNSALVKRLLIGRSWWVQTENINDAHFIWTQWKDKSICSSLPKGKDIINTFDISVSPSINYQIPVKMNEVYKQVDISDLGLSKIKNSQSYTTLKTTDIINTSQKLYNKLEFNQHLANKKGLYKCLKTYYELMGNNIFNYHPITFNIKNCEKDPEFLRFVESFQSFEKRKAQKKCKNIWIVKPGENSNRGNGITVCRSINQIKAVIREGLGRTRTFIVQKYIEKPFLLHNRKFDIRCYALVTSINGVIQGYFYNDGYLRTSSAEFTLKDIENNYVHLTNDAIQKHCDDYGKFEDSNKLSYKEFQRYLDVNHSDKKYNFFANILPQIKNIVKDTIGAVFLKLDPNKRLNAMEVFGYDFMLDHRMRPWIIEANTNPCLELSSSYLSYLIPAMLDNSFRITLDSFFPPGFVSKNSFEPLLDNKFELIFHQMTDGLKLKDLTNTSNPQESEVSDVEHEDNNDLSYN